MHLKFSLTIYLYLESIVSKYLMWNFAVYTYVLVNIQLCILNEVQLKSEHDPKMAIELENYVSMKYTTKYDCKLKAID